MADPWIRVAGVVSPVVQDPCGLAILGVRTALMRHFAQLVTGGPSDDDFVKRVDVDGGRTLVVATGF